MGRKYTTSTWACLWRSGGQLTLDAVGLKRILNLHTSASRDRAVLRELMALEWAATWKGDGPLI
jgi:hypothetical protein